MISIILGTYNRFNKLKNSINSIREASKQLSEPAEIIIIDGGSTDQTVDFIKNNRDIVYLNEGGLHGVTRAYNRGFRLATKEYITWSSDDFVYLPDCLKNTVNRLKRENKKTLISLSIDVLDGKGFVNYGSNTPIGAGHRDVFRCVDYWSEDFITYASDNDFSMKIHMAGGKVVPEPSAKVKHNIDLNDNLHKENLKDNKCSLRYRNLYSKGIKSFKNGCVNIWINASSFNELIQKVENARLNNGWVNFYTDKDFSNASLLNSMNVMIEPFKGKDHYLVL